MSTVSLSQIASSSNGTFEGRYGEEPVAIRSDDDIAVGRDGGAGREREADAVGEAPAGEADGCGTDVVQFDEFVGVILGDGIEHDFVDDDLAEEGFGVGRIWCFAGQFAEGG